MPRERTSRRSGREPLPMQTLVVVRRCQAARIGTPHIHSTPPPRALVRQRHAQPEQNIQHRVQGTLRQEKPGSSQAAKHQSPGDAPDQPPAKRRGPERRPAAAENALQSLQPPYAHTTATIAVTISAVWASSGAENSKACAVPIARGTDTSQQRRHAQRRARHDHDSSDNSARASSSRPPSSRSSPSSSGRGFSGSMGTRSTGQSGRPTRSHLAVARA